MPTAIQRDIHPPLLQPQPAERHPIPVIVLHWATALIGLTVVVLALMHEFADGKLVRAVLLDGHRAFGVLVLALTLARLFFRVRHHPLPLAVSASLLHRIAIGTMHLALYGLLLAVPLLGWALTNAQGHTVSLFGLLRLPAVVEGDPDLADELGEIHEWAAWLLIGAVALHAAAALWHHFIRRDPVLLSMLPRGRGMQSADIGGLPDSPHFTSNTGGTSR